MVQCQRVLPTATWLYKSLAVVYTILLGFALPFICWGTLATPSHPHRMAHLVFFMPPMRVEISAQRNTSEHKIHLQRQHEGEFAAADAQPIGRSVPDELTSAITILSPLFLVAMFLVIAPARLIRRLSKINPAHLFDPRVLTPPPRRLYL